MRLCRVLLQLGPQHLVLREQLRRDCRILKSICGRGKHSLVRVWFSGCSQYRVIGVLHQAHQYTETIVVHSSPQRVPTVEVATTSREG